VGVVSGVNEANETSFDEEIKKSMGTKKRRRPQNVAQKKAFFSRVTRTT